MSYNGSVNLADPKIQRICDALKGRQLLESELEWDENYNEHCEKIAHRLFKHDDRGRTLDTIRDAVIKGTQCELAVATLLSDAGIGAAWNDNASTFDWDLVTDDLVKIEVKSQSYHDKKGLVRKYFSYSFDDQPNAHKKIETFKTMWEHYDVLLAVKVKVMQGDRVFLPWVLIDSVAFSASKNLFVPSTFEQSGWFLKMDICQQQGLLRPLS